MLKQIARLELLLHHVRIGYLHATNRRPESLNLDMAEAYRPLIVDRIVFSMVNLKSIQLTDFTRTDSGGVYLSDNEKRKFLRAFYEKWSRNTPLTVGVGPIDGLSRRIFSPLFVISVVAIPTALLGR